jgi:hypothetical protein
MLQSILVSTFVRKQLSLDCITTCSISILKRCSDVCKRTQEKNSLLTYLIHGAQFFLRLTGSELVMNSWHFTESEGSLPDSQVRATCPYPETGQSSPCPPSHVLKIHLNIILPSKPVSSKWSPSCRFLHQNPLYTSPLPNMCYMPRPSHSFYLITWTILG